MLSQPTDENKNVDTYDTYTLDPVNSILPYSGFRHKNITITSSTVEIEHYIGLLLPGYAADRNIGSKKTVNYPEPTAAPVYSPH